MFVCCLFVFVFVEWYIYSSNHRRDGVNDWNKTVKHRHTYDININCNLFLFVLASINLVSESVMRSNVLMINLV